MSKSKCNSRTGVFSSAILSLIFSLNVHTGAVQAQTQQNAQSKSASAGAEKFAGVGRPATAKEVAAWDIDVRPDFAGLPKGSGSVSKGMVVWESKCASCHGYFGESNEVFNAITGGTTKADIQTGRTARLNDSSFPQRTTMMKLSNLSTLWDYINRAMPWNAPKSLTVEEVYAVTAYILNLGGIVEDSFTLSHNNMAQMQALLPNRNGMSTAHGLWPGRELINASTAGQSPNLRPDTNAKRCMTDCAGLVTVQSELPAFARDAHGNLLDQNRLVGPQRGALTKVSTAIGTTSASAAKPALSVETSVNPANAVVVDFKKLLDKNGCTGCHQVDGKLLGPSFKEISTKYSKQASGQDYLVSKIRKGSVGVWGSIPMPEQTIPESEAITLARWMMQ